MDAFFCRRLFSELPPVLHGARFDKAAMPAPGLYTLTLSGLAPDQAGQRPKYLLFRHGGGRMLLFLSRHKQANPASPPAEVMYLRKRLAGRRIMGLAADWPTRRLALELTPGESRFLLFDPSRGLGLIDALPEGFGREPEFPTAAEILADPDIWRTRPFVSPVLRKMLASLDPPAAEAYLRRLAAHEPGQAYVYGPPDAPVGVWPLSWPDGFGGDAPRRPFATAILAAEAYGLPLLFAGAAAPEAHDAARAARAGEKRRTRALARLDEDARRMEALAGQADAAEALAANLYRFARGEKRARVTIEDHRGGPLTLELDPSQTVVGNMERLFALAAKGRRGLGHIGKRREILRNDRDDLSLPDTRSRPPAQSRGGPGEARGRGGAGAARTPGQASGAADATLRRYRSSDGFTILRGRSAKANDRLVTRGCAPHDLWFHVKDGPGAHVVIRRDHPGQVVPERSLEEAAVLAGLSSFRKGEARAEVLMALAAEVRKIKGAASGQVAVDAVARTFRVALDPELETRLALER